MLSAEERELLDVLPGPIVAAGAGGSIIYANQALCKLLDYDHPAELVGQPLTTLMPERMVNRHRQGFGNYRRTGRSRLLGKRIRVPALTRTDREVAVDLRIRLFRRPDGTDLIVGAMGLASNGDDAIDMAVSQVEADLVERTYSLV